MGGVQSWKGSEGFGGWDGCLGSRSGCRGEKALGLCEETISIIVIMSRSPDDPNGNRHTNVHPLFTFPLIPPRALVPSTTKHIPIPPLRLWAQPHSQCRPGCYRLAQPTRTGTRPRRRLRWQTAISPLRGVLLIDVLPAGSVRDVRVGPGKVDGGWVGEHGGGEVILARREMRGAR